MFSAPLGLEVFVANITFFPFKRMQSALKLNNERLLSKNTWIVTNYSSFVKIWILPQMLYENDLLFKTYTTVSLKYLPISWFVKLKLYMILFISLYDFIWDLYWSQRNQYSTMQHIVPTFSSYEICNDIKYLNLCNYSIFMTCRRILWDVLSLLQ